MPNGESSHSDPDLSQESLTLCCGKKNCPTVRVSRSDLDNGRPMSIELEDEGRAIQMGRDQAELLRDWLNTHFPA